MKVTEQIKKRFYTINDVAEWGPWAPQTIRNLLSSGTFPIKPKRIGRKVVFDIKDLETWADNLSEDYQEAEA
ncbi:MAG: helix-turn-helix domain-containing protein [Desulfatibacillum sp.]|nr:helix-turn-helix domain-containing protein [Desulfatibacillum sp.]